MSAVREVSATSRREVLIRTFWVLTDGLCWVLAVLGTLWVRLDIAGPVLVSSTTWLLALGAGALHIGVGIFLGPYMVRHLRGSFEEVTAVARAVAVTGLTLIAVAFVVPQASVPRSIPFLSAALALVLMLASRFVVRSYRARRAAQRAEGEKVVVLGAGLAGRRLVHNILHDEWCDLVPVAFLDDDRHKRRLTVEGVKVMGTRQDLAAVVQRTGASHLVVAIPRADSELLLQVRAQARDAGISVKVLPPLEAWGHQADPQGTDLRDLNLEDLLGRRAVELDQHVISEHLTGKVVLVTGAGGSIGSELCRQIHLFSPARLVMLDRDESALHGAQLSISGRALLEGEDLLLADIRDADAMQRHFGRVKPDVVFHAAALKHLSLLERFPDEAWQTNVLGTRNVLQASAAVGVGTFVNISTDKAASPTSILGKSKRAAERLTAHYAQREMGRYVSVRFGNVLGSRGSVIPAFTEQIRRGGPVTVTHPDVERYFMLIPEACQLVMQAGAIGRDGQVMVLDMGTPVRIVDVANELIALSGKKVDILFTGLRSGEKLSEVLFTAGEEHKPTDHPLMTAVDVPRLDPADLTLLTGLSEDRLRQWLTSQAGQGDLRLSQG